MMEKGAPETYPLFISVGKKDGWARENIINSAQDWVVGETIIYKGTTPYRVTDELKSIYMSGDFP